VPEGRKALEGHEAPEGHEASEGRQGQAEVVFYALSRKFVDDDQGRTLRPEIRQLRHYTLAIGHHIGVVDCLTPVLTIGEEAYGAWVAKLPPGPARKKLEGLLRWGEIEVRRDFAEPLAAALAAAAPAFTPAEQQWAEALQRLCRAMAEEPAFYLVVRRRDPAGDDRRQRTDGR